MLDDHFARRIQLHEAVDFGVRNSSRRQLRFFQTHQLHKRRNRIDEHAGDAQLFQFRKAQEQFERVDDGAVDAGFIGDLLGGFVAF